MSAARESAGTKSNDVESLTFGASSIHDPTQQQDIIAKLNELIFPLRR
jgi:hypothetical protein